MEQQGNLSASAEFTAAISTRQRGSGWGLTHQCSLAFYILVIGVVCLLVPSDTIGAIHFCYLMSFPEEG